MIILITKQIKEVLKMSNEEKSFPNSSINWEITTYGKLIFSKDQEGGIYDRFSYNKKCKNSYY